MSTEEWNYRDEAEQWITCPYCEAGFGERCRTSGGRYTAPHGDRKRPLMAAWRAGWLEGYETGKCVGERQAARS